MNLYKRFGKRMVDVSAAFVGLIVFSPVFLLCAALVKCTSPGRVLFRQTRVGRNGRSFNILKFRTMVDEAERIGPGITARMDSRVTAVGRILRKTKLDELPQLANVLKGEMSLVGPRPELPKYVALYTPEQRLLLDVRPGITDVASLVFRNEEQILAEAECPLSYYENCVMPRKLSLSLEGVSRMSLGYDLRLIVMTVLGISTNLPPDALP